jgi:hypothetical protein
MNENNQARDPLLLPWYAHLVVGILVSGFFSWFIVAWVLFKRGKNTAASAILTLNVLFGAAVWYFGGFVNTEWWLTSLIDLAVNLIWAGGAAGIQFRILGPAPRRFESSRFKAMVPPLATSVVLGFCAGVTLCIPSLIKNASAMSQSADILDRTSIIIDIIRHGLTGIPFGIFAGIWWSASVSRFKPSTVVATAFGSIISMCAIFVFLQLFNFIAHGGYFSTNYTAAGSLVLPWTGGIPRALTQVETYSGYLGFICLGLFFGTPQRMRDFWGRLLVPLALIMCFFPSMRLDKFTDEFLQDQLYYNLSSPHIIQRRASHQQLEVFLKRYPDHVHWCHLASQHAEFLYDEGHFNESRKWWQAVIDRDSLSKPDFHTVRYARAVLARRWITNHISTATGWL